MKEIKCTALFLDVRNFTEQLSDKSKKEKFIKVIEEIYLCGLNNCKKIVSDEKFYINSTGDGFLIVIFSEKHYIEGFLLALKLQSEATEIFKNNNWKEPKNGEYYIGIGLESGSAVKVMADSGNKKIETYLGDVINVAARLESLSKEHARAPIIYGLELNELIVKDLFGESYKALMDKAKENPNNPKKYHDKMNEINSKLLSSYLFEHKLKGVTQATPVFRISPTLFFAGKAKEEFMNLVKEKLPAICQIRI